MQAKQFSKALKSGRLQAACAAALYCGVASAATIDPELEWKMARDNGVARYPVVIRLAKQPDIAALGRQVASLPQGRRGGGLIEALRSFNKPLQAPIVQNLAARHAEAVTPLVTVNAVAAHVSAKDIRELAQRGEIADIRYDIGLVAPSRRAMADPCKPARPTPRARLPKACRTPPKAAPVEAGVAFDASIPGSQVMTGIGAPVAWKAGYTGKGVTVAIVDSGVDALHRDLAGSFRGGKADWFDVHGQHARPVDRHGHGTQLAGLIVGAGASGQTLGVAPQARWIAARVYNDSNVGRLSQIHQIMAWLLDPDGNPATDDAPQIVLNAWGLGDRPGTCDSEFAADIGLLRAAGMHVVFAAGNGGPIDNSSVSPANNTGALAVGALDALGGKSLFSSHGVSACDARPYPDLWAPGEVLRTTDLAIPGVATTTAVSGTSYAAALVVGELALLAQARPKMTATERETLLQPTAEPRPALLRALGVTEDGSREKQP